MFPFLTCTIVEEIVFFRGIDKDYRVTLTEKMHVTPTRRLPYLFSAPKGGMTNGAFPLIFFLHGAGERGLGGADMARICHYGIPRAVREMEDFPFYTVSPQCPPGMYWEDVEPQLFSLLDETLADHPIDPTRVYLTGLSMGGHGTWVMALSQPERFAALVPVCPPYPSRLITPDRLLRLRDMPIWVFHGQLDDIVPLMHSERMVTALRVINNPARFTVYPNARHDSWSETYANPDLYAWLLEHSRKGT